MKSICCNCLSREGCECGPGASVPLPFFLAKVEPESLRLERTHLETVAVDPKWQDQKAYCEGKIKRIDELLELWREIR